MTGPTAEDVIADVLCARRGLHQSSPVAPIDRPCHVCREESAAVVAAIRAATVEQQAELLDGYVEVPVLNEPLRRPVGPWRRVEP